LFLEYGIKFLVDVLERIQDGRAEMLRHRSAVTFRDYPVNRLAVEARFVRPPAPQGIILVGKVHDPAFQRDVFSLKISWIAAPVPSLVVTAGDYPGFLQEFRRGGFEDLFSYDTMRLHEGELFRVQLPEFKEDLRRNSHLADVLRGALTRWASSGSPP
jgi:hypothetical protein